MTEITIKIKTPSVPNFVTLDIPSSSNEGFKELPTMRVGDLTDHQLNNLIQDWREALFAVVLRQRNEKRK